jgi:hypothetical protein
MSQLTFTKVVLEEATDAQLVAELNRRSRRFRTPMERELIEAELAGFQHQAEAVYYEMQRDPEAARRFVAECAGRIA